MDQRPLPPGMNAGSYAQEVYPPGGRFAAPPGPAMDFQPGHPYREDPWLRAPTLQPSGASFRAREPPRAETPAAFRGGLDRDAPLMPSFQALAYGRDPFDESFHSKTRFASFSDRDRAFESLSTASTAESFRYPSLGSPLSPPASKPSTLLIFDWDDTLMCSSALNAGNFQPHQFVQLETLVGQVLTTSMRLGETVIVTNADQLWVTESTRRFLPRVLPLLSRIHVVSARKLFEQSWPGDVFAWKREAFREVIVPWQSTAMAPGGMHLVILGDSAAEMEAAHSSLVGLVSPSAVKTVKFKEMPSAEELLEQLRLINQELPIIVAEDRSSNRNLASQLWLQSPSAPSTLPPTAYGTMSFGGRFGMPLSAPII